jgi:hypothetical protein
MHTNNLEQNCALSSLQECEATLVCLKHINLCHECQANGLFAHSSNSDACLNVYLCFQAFLCELEECT